MLDSHWKATDKMVSRFQGKKPEMAYLLAMESLNLNSNGPGDIGTTYFFTRSEEEASLDEKYMCYPGAEQLAPNVKKKPKIKQSDDEIKKEKLRLMRDRKYFVALAKKRDPLCLEYFEQQSEISYYTHLGSRLECKNEDDLKFLSEMHAMAMQKFLTPPERDYLNSVKLEIKR